MINGNSVIMQVAKETAYGTLVEMTKQYKISTESLKASYNKKDEGVATGGRGSGLKQTMGIKGGGSFSILGRPDDIGLILKCLCGVESVAKSAGSETAYLHTFTAIGTKLTDSLPSLSITVDRKAGVFAYIGSKIDECSFSAAAEDFLKLDVTVVCKDERTGTVSTTLVPSVLRALRFAGAKVYISDSEIADVTSIKFDYKNNCDSSTQTTGTGLYYMEPQPGTREITADLEMLYSVPAETIRNLQYKTDNTFKIVIDFKSDDKADGTNPYELKITIPCAQCSDATANMGGLETLKQSISCSAVDNLSDELVMFELTNTASEAY